MAQDYKAILQLLYAEFGDDLIDIGKTVIENKLQEKKSSGGNSASAEKAGEGCIADSSISSDQSTDLKKDGMHSDTLGSTDDQSEGHSVSNSYYDADLFEKRTIAEYRENIPTIMDSENVIQTVEKLILMAGEVRKFEEAQITVRTDIAAQRDIAIANIEMQKTALLTYLDKSFDERKESFTALFSVVDDALEKDNMQELAMSLEGIIKLADSSPFKDLQTIEATASALTNPNHEWNF